VFQKAATIRTGTATFHLNDTLKITPLFDKHSGARRNMVDGISIK
jgi:hypothetical protein